MCMKLVLESLCPSHTCACTDITTPIDNDYVTCYDCENYHYLGDRIDD
jgi:hypothetical protein